MFYPKTREKIKIRFDPIPVEPDPPPFVCDVCGKEREYYQLLHKGEKKMCWDHMDRRTGIPTEARVAMDWRDHSQLCAIATIIGEIKNGSR